VNSTDIVNPVVETGTHETVTPSTTLCGSLRRAADTEEESQSFLLIITHAGLSMASDGFSHTPRQRTHPGMRQERLFRRDRELPLPQCLVLQDLGYRKGHQISGIWLEREY